MRKRKTPPSTAPYRQPSQLVYELAQVVRHGVTEEERADGLERLHELLAEEPVQDVVGNVLQWVVGICLFSAAFTYLISGRASVRPPMETLLRQSLIVAAITSVVVLAIFSAGYFGRRWRDWDRLHCAEELGRLAHPDSLVPLLAQLQPQDAEMATRVRTALRRVLARIRKKDCDDLGIDKSIALAGALRGMDSKLALISLAVLEHGGSPSASNLVLELDPGSAAIAEQKKRTLDALTRRAELQTRRETLLRASSDEAQLLHSVDPDRSALLHAAESEDL